MLILVLCHLALTPECRKGVVLIRDLFSKIAYLKGSVQKRPFSRDSREFSASRDSRESPDCGKQSRIHPFCRDSREFRDSRDSRNGETPFVMTPFSGPDLKGVVLKISSLWFSVGADSTPNVKEEGEQQDGSGAGYEEFDELPDQDRLTLDDAMFYHSGAALLAEVGTCTKHSDECCESFFTLQHSKMPRTPNLSKICPDDCFSEFQSAGPKFVENLSKI